jgi:hypothetical protein
MLFLKPGDILQVEMEAMANEYAAGGGTAGAVADPSFQVDPSFPDAGSFSFAVSPNLVPATVPEPRAFWLLASCLGILAFLVWQRRRRARQESTTGR